MNKKLILRTTILLTTMVLLTLGAFTLSLTAGLGMFWLTEAAVVLCLYAYSIDSGDLSIHPTTALFGILLLVALAMLSFLSLLIRY